MTDQQFAEKTLAQLEELSSELNHIRAAQRQMEERMASIEKNISLQISELKNHLAQLKVKPDFIPISPATNTEPEKKEQAAPVIESVIVEPEFKEIPPIPAIEHKPIEHKTEEVEHKHASKENLNEKLAKVKKESAAERLSHTKIADLRKSLNLNQTMAFTKTFFKGDSNQFSSFIESLNQCGSLESAETILRSQVDASKNTELYHDLLLLIERRWGI